MTDTSMFSEEESALASGRMPTPTERPTAPSIDEPESGVLDVKPSALKLARRALDGDQAAIDRIRRAQQAIQQGKPVSQFDLEAGYAYFSQRGRVEAEPSPKPIEKPKAPKWLGDSSVAKSLGDTQSRLLQLTRPKPFSRESAERMEMGAMEPAEELVTLLTEPARNWWTYFTRDEGEIKGLQEDQAYLTESIVPWVVDNLDNGADPEAIRQSLGSQGIVMDGAMGELVEKELRRRNTRGQLARPKLADGEYAKYFRDPEEVAIAYFQSLPPMSDEEHEVWSAENVPFYGMVLEYAESEDLEASINRLAKGEGTTEDEDRVVKHLEQMYRRKTSGYAAESGIGDAMAFGGEMATGELLIRGLIGTGRAGARLLGITAEAAKNPLWGSGVRAALQGSLARTGSLLNRFGRAAGRPFVAAEKTTERIAAAKAAGKAVPAAPGAQALSGVSRLGRAVGRGTGSFAAAEGVSEAIGGGRSSVKQIQSQINESLGFYIDPRTGELEILAQETEGPQDLQWENIYSTWTEYISERLGALLPGGSRLFKTPAGRNRLLKLIGQRSGGSAGRRLARVMEKATDVAAIDDIIPEVLEEYAARGLEATGQWVTGSEDLIDFSQVIPASAKEIADELIAVASAGVFLRAAPMAVGMGISRLTETPRQRKLRKLINDELLTDLELAETDPEAAERVKQRMEAARQASPEEIQLVLDELGAQQAEGEVSPQVAEVQRRFGALGIQVVAVENMPEDRNGAFDERSPGTIYLRSDLDAEAANTEVRTLARSVGVHELVHDARNILGEEAVTRIMSRVSQAEGGTQLIEDVRSGFVEDMGDLLDEETAAALAEAEGGLVWGLINNPKLANEVRKIVGADLSLLNRFTRFARSLIPGLATTEEQAEKMRAKLARMGMPLRAERSTQAQLEIADAAAAVITDAAAVRAFNVNEQIAKLPLAEPTEEEVVPAVEGEPLRATPSPVAERAAEQFLEQEMGRPAGQPLPVRPTEAPIEPSPVMPGARVRINEDAAAFDDIIRQAQEIPGLEVVDVTGPAGAQRVEVRVPGEMGTLIVPESDVSLAQPAPGQPTVEGMPAAEAMTEGMREAQEQTREDAIRGRIRFSQNPANSSTLPGYDTVADFTFIEDTFWDRFYQNFVNRFGRVDQIVDWAKGIGLITLPEQDISLIIKNSFGKRQNRLEEFESNFMQPIEELRREYKLSLMDVDDYLMAMHAEGANNALKARRVRAQELRAKAKEMQAEVRGLENDGRVRAINKLIADLRKEANRIDPGEGAYEYMPTERTADMDPDIMTAEEVLAALREKHGGDLSKLEEVAQKVYEMNAWTRRHQRETGQISEETLSRWESTFPDGRYVPMRDAEADTGYSAPIRGQAGSGFSVAPTRSRMRKGRKSRPGSPLNWSTLQGQRAIMRGVKAEVGREFYTFVKNAGQIIEEEKLLEDEAAPEEVREYQGRKLLGEKRPDPGKFLVTIDGQRIVIGLKDAELARAMKSLNLPQLGAFLEFSRKATRWFSAARTTFSPDFLLARNPQRDAYGAYILMQRFAEQGQRFAEQGYDIPSFAEFSKVWFQARKTIVNRVRGKEPGPLEQRDKEWREAGGLIGFGGEYKFDDLEKELERATAEGGMAEAMRRLRDSGMVTYLKSIADASEQSTRLAVFATLRDAGVSEIEAAAFSRDASVDFNRAGYLGPAFNAAMAFWNSRVQGIAMMTNSLTASAKVRQVALNTIALGYLHDQAMRWLLGDDEETGRPIWNSKSDFERLHHLHIPFGGDKTIMLSLPHIMLPFWSLGSNLSRYQSGEVTAGEAAIGIGKTLFESFSPMSSDDMRMPFTIGKPVIAVVSNIDEWGNAIAPTTFPGEVKKGYEKAEELGWGSDVSIGVVKAINDLVGTEPGEMGNSVQQWVGELAPADLDYMFGWITGAGGQAVMRWAEDNPLTPDFSEIPVFRALVSGHDKRDADRDYRELRDITKYAYQAYNDAKGADKRDIRKRIKAAHGAEIDTYEKYFTGANAKKVRELNEKIREAEGDEKERLMLQRRHEVAKAIRYYDRKQQGKDK